MTSAASTKRKGRGPDRVQRSRASSPKVTRECSFCGKTFQAQRASTVTCSNACLQGTRGSTCCICGRGLVIVSTSSVDVSRRGHKECYQAVGVVRACKYRICGKEFVARTANQDYCTRGHAASEFQYLQGNPCAICGELVASNGSRSAESPRHLSCIPKQARIRTHHLRSHSRLDRPRILERDGWVCQICFTPTDEGGGRLSPHYPTLDHIVPLKSFLDMPVERAKELAHADANLQTAHRFCNISKNASETTPDEVIAEKYFARYSQMKFY